MSVLNQFSLSGKTILITGATSGIGETLALACADAGACVAAIGRKEAKLSELKAKLSEKSTLPHFTGSFDVTNFPDIPTLVRQIVEQCGRIAGFVHCAGIVESTPLRMMTPRIYEEIYRTNVISGYEIIKELSKRKNLDDSSFASYVLVSSVSALRGEPGLLAYSASKGAILAGTRALAAELAGKKIRVNAIIPGLITDTPLGLSTLTGLPEDARQRMEQKHYLGFGKTASLTGPVIFLLSSASEWITGSSVCVDGGYTL